MQSHLRVLVFPLLLILLTTSLITPQPSRNRFNTRITSNQLFLYTFTEGQTAPDETHSRDVSGQSSFGDMLLNTDSSEWSTKRIGVKFDGTGDQTRVVSSNNSSNLLNRIGVTQSWTFEAWFIPDNVNQGGMIAGIGLWEPGAIDTVCASPQGTTSLSIFQEGSSYGMYILGGNAQVPFCTQPSGFIDSSPRLFHVAGTSDGNIATVYLNGEFHSSTKMFNAYWRWNPAARLYLAQQGNQLTGLSWKGEVMMVSMYDRALSPAEITTNYNAGLPNSKPIGIVNGTAIALQNQLTFFSNLSLSYYDYDNDSCTLYLSALPTIGDLYLYNISTNSTTLLLQSQLPLPITNATRFAYRAPPNAWGPGFTSFQYYANDATASGYRTNVNIDVQLVPRPPVANSANYTLYPTYHVGIDLDGYNFNDLNDRAADAAIITSLPVNGNLFLSVDGVTPLNKITLEMLPHRIERNQGHRWVMYYANDYILKQHSGMEVLWTDVFNFRVANQNWTSVPESPGIITLRVSNPFSIQDFSTNVAEGATQLLINLAALTKVNSQKSETIVLITLPQYGQLSLSADSKSPEPGMKLSPSRAQLLYKINPVVNYQHHTSDSFTYQLQFADGFTSVMATVFFNIQPMRQAPILTSSYANNTMVFDGSLESMLSVRHNLTLLSFSDPLMDDPSREYTVSFLSRNFFTVRLNPSLDLTMTSNALSTSFTANMSIITAALALSFFQIQADTASKYEIVIPITISEASAAGPLSSDITVFIRQKPISTTPQALQSQSANLVSQRLYLILGFAVGGLVLCVVFILYLRHQTTKREKQRQEMRQAVKAQETKETNDEPEETDGSIEAKPKRKKLKESPQKPLRSKKRTPVTTLTPEETDGAVKRKVNRQLFTSTNPGPEGEMEPAASTPRARVRQLPSAATAFAQHCQARFGVELTEYQDGETYDNPLHDASEWGAGDADDVRLQVNDRFTSTTSTINDSPNRHHTSTYYPTANDSSRRNSWESETSTGAFTASNMTTLSKYTNSSSCYTTTPSRHTTTPSRYATTPSRHEHHAYAAAPGGVSQESYMPRVSSTAPASYISGPTPRRSPSNLSSATAPAAPTMSHPVTPPRRAVPSSFAIVTDASASVPLVPSTPSRTPLREPPPADPTGTPRAGATAGFRSPSSFDLSRQ